MNLRKRTENNNPSSGERKRPRRSCVIDAEKRKEKKEKDEILIDLYCSYFYAVVTNYCLFLSEMQYKINNDSTNLSYQRKYDELLSELYTFCDYWKNEIELDYIYFHPKGLPDRKTTIIWFNYENPKEFINQKCMEESIRAKLNIQFEINEHIEFVAVCQRKSVSPKIVHIDNFASITCNLTNDIAYRLDAFMKNKVYSKRIKELLSIRYNKKETEEKCSICQEEFKIKEKLYKIPSCHHIFHQQCLKNCLKVSCRCPICNHILS